MLVTHVSLQKPEPARTGSTRFLPCPLARDPCWTRAASPSLRQPRASPSRAREGAGASGAGSAPQSRLCRWEPPGVRSRVPGVRSQGFGPRGPVRAARAFAEARPTCGGGRGRRAADRTAAALAIPRCWPGVRGGHQSPAAASRSVLARPQVTRSPAALRKERT